RRYHPCAEPLAHRIGRGLAARRQGSQRRRAGRAADRARRAVPVPLLRDGIVAAAEGGSATTETHDTRAHLLQVAEALQPAPERLPLRIMWTIAIASGATVANLYYNQPLLPGIGRSFSASLHAVGLVPTLTQVGYGLGMLLVVPLGDARERRRLVVTCIGAAAVALVAIALSPNLPWLLAASLVMGIATCVPQILVPFAAGLALPGRRGRAVGTVMSGLLFGILLSRTLSGFVGAAVGWRVMYLVAAVLMI